jgi:CubicO group peptidase (beta-lactamase class C family)
VTLAPDSLASDSFAAVDAIAEDFQHRNGQPGLAYGVVAGGRLVHARGLGQRSLGGAAPDAGTVFRIASMTKSFTASAVLALRDDGALALDDPAENYVSELRGMPPATADSAPITLRHLLTMTAGFPTDDPWGDRQQSLPLAEFSELLAVGVRFAWAPGTRFEYSNMGYAILGRVISAVSGLSYPDFVRDRLLAPLGMTRTGFEASEFPAEQLALGYRRAAGWTELELDGYGAFAPMGGIFTCVADLARWVAGFTAAFPPGGDEDPHPLRRATRREMQLPQVALEPGEFVLLPGGPGPAGPMSYGFGLFIEQDATWGRIVQHSGGYPGFGSHMRWHAATGAGVITLANSTYAGAGTLAAKLLDAVLRGSENAGRSGPARQPELAPAGPWPETLAARLEVSQLLRTWDDATARRLFTENVAQDESYPERQRKAGQIRERIGDFRDHPDRPAEHDSPAHCRWWLRGDRGVAQAEILLNPENPPRVQQVTLAVPPAPGSPLHQILDSLLSLLNGGASGWPPALPVSRTIDRHLVLRRLRMAAAWAGPCHLGAFRAGDGENSSTVELDGQHARLILSVAVCSARSELQEVDIAVMEPGEHAGAAGSGGNKLVDSAGGPLGWPITARRACASPGFEIRGCHATDRSGSCDHGPERRDGGLRQQRHAYQQLEPQQQRFGGKLLQRFHSG